MLFAPLEGWRHVQVTDRRTKVDFAHCIKDLLIVHFPEAEHVTIVMDNLNTPHPSSLYELRIDTLNRQALANQHEKV